MLGYTIQVDNLSPRPSISLIPVATPTLFSCTGIPACPEERRVYHENRGACANETTHLHRDSCLKQQLQLRSCAFFADSPPRNLHATPPSACTTISPCQRTCFLPSGAPPASPSAPYGASPARFSTNSPAQCSSFSLSMASWQPGANGRRAPSSG